MTSKKLNREITELGDEIGYTGKLRLIFQSLDYEEYADLRGRSLGTVKNWFLKKKLPIAEANFIVGLAKFHYEKNPDLFIWEVIFYETESEQLLKKNPELGSLLLEFELMKILFIEASSSDGALSRGQDEDYSNYRFTHKLYVPMQGYNHKKHSHTPDV